METRRSSPILALGIDIDGTITADPEFFRQLAASCRAASIPVHIVSSRSREGLLETREELKGFGIRYDHLHLTAPISDAQNLCPHRNLDWFARHQWLKVAYSLQEGLSHFVDDDDRVIALFEQFAPKISAIRTADRQCLVSTSGRKQR